MNSNEQISELLGILNSINYDEVINNLEIEALGKWIEINSNNKDPRLQEIIKKLRKILDDKVITNDERKEISAIVEQYYNIGIVYDKIFELIGIVEGIIFDNEINLMEINNLKIWLEINKKLKGTYFYDRLVLVVNEVLEDGKLDDKEKNTLKTLLTFLLKDNKINQKIDILKNKIVEKEIIGMQLISLIDDSTIVKKIHNAALQQLKKLFTKNCSVYSIDCEIVFLSLTLIGLLNYDSNFWNYVRQEYAELYEKYNEQKIEGQIRNIINKYKTDDDTRIISYVLKNTIVPKPFLPSFFDFIFDIYRLNFGYNIDPQSNLNNEFLFVYEGIKKEMNCDEDDLILNVTHKTYRLIKTTKELILDETQISSLIELSVEVLKIIDNFYWSNDTNDIENEYYKYGFENWKNKSEKDIKESKIKDSKLVSRWEPEFKLINTQVYLSIPNHKIKSHYNYKKLKIEIFNDDIKIYENNTPDVYDIIGGYRIEQNENVKIDKPLGKVRYILSCDDEIIYDSKQKLYKDYIFFNESGSELKNNRDYKGLAILCSKEENTDMQKSFMCGDYILSYKSVNFGDYIKVNNEIFNFSTILNPGIIGKEKVGKVIIDGIKQNVYEEIEGIVYESKKTSSNIVIIINNERHKLSDFEYEEKMRGLYYNYFIKLQLKNNIYSLNIEELENGFYICKEKFNFVLDKEFNLYIEESNVNEYLETITFLDKKYIKAINYDKEDINNLLFENDNIEFIIPNGLCVYKLDNNRWADLKDSNNYIWIDDINAYSNLRISGFEFTSVQVKDESTNLLTTYYPSVQEYYYDISIGSLRSYYSHKFIYLDFYNEDKKLGFLKVYCKCFINEKLTNIYFDKDDNKYYGIINYYGKGNIIAKVTDSKNEIIYEKQLMNNDKIELESLRSFENYKLEILEKKSGFTLQSNNVLYIKNIKYYSLDDFVGRYFQIYAVNYDQKIMGKYIEKTRNLYNTYLEITKQVDKSNFIGNVYIYKGKKKYVDKVNPVEVEFVSDPDVNGYILAYITNEGEMLINDFENHTILNEMENIEENDVPIYSYIINMERKR